MAVKTYCCGQGRHEVRAAVNRCGSDLSVNVYGGERGHIGAAAAAMLQADGQATAKVICLPGHREAELVKAAALSLCASTGVTVLVSGGLHIDNADKYDIMTLQDNFNKIIQFIDDDLQAENNERRQSKS